MKAPLPDNELQRVQALREYAIVDTMPEREFDDLALLASQICRTPIALLNLVDSDRQWFKARIGLDTAEIPRHFGFCSHTILQSGLFIVPDTTADARFASDPLVAGDPRIRFYAGAPLITAAGLAVGTVCVWDRVPRTLSTEQEEALWSLSRQVISQLELRRINRLPAATVADNESKDENLGAEELLRVVTEGTAAVTGSDFFRSLVRHLSQALVVRYAFIAECTDAAKTKVRTLAFWTGAGFGDDVAFLLRGTPCEKVIGGEVCCYPKSLQALFPEDEGLVGLNAESYMGLPLCDSSAEILGHLVVMDDKPMRATQRYIPVLRIFAARAAVELQRKHAEEALKRSEERVRMLLDINNAIITKLARDELFSAICAALARVVPFDRVALTLYEPELNALRLITYAGPYQRSDYTPIGRVLELNDSPAGAAFLQQKPFLRRDLETVHRSSSEERAFGHGFRSLCALPLIIHGNGIGAITVGSLTRFQYTEADAEFLMQVANQVAIAIDNMRSHEETAALKARLQAENVYLQEEIKTEYNFEEIVGQSPSILRVLENVEPVARTDSTVLIQGETGTGKELLARAIHNLSPRRDRPLVKVNCGAIPAGLVESELFGHERGAFTGAVQKRIGRFELADRGTIFLDEISELPPETQVKLLRVLQEGEFERVGSSTSIKIDVRVIAATNRDLHTAVRASSFRADLFYRLNVILFEVPPLRDRKPDIPLLVNFYLSRFARKFGKQIKGVSNETMNQLVNYGWPGNIRELQNVVERATVLARGPIINIEPSMLAAASASGFGEINTLEDIERAHILKVLKDNNWVIHGNEGAAAILKINPSTLRSRMQKLGIRKPDRIQ